MSLAAILFSVLFFSLYLPFSRAATAHYPSADALAGFFGLFSAVTTAAALITSLFLTNRMITRFGVTTMLLVLAVIYLAGFGVLIVSGTFVTLVVVRFVQMLWSQAVANPAWEAVINIVPPARRDQTRAFLNGGPTQLGTMIAGLIQLIGLRRLSAIQLYAIGSGTAALLTFAMWKVGRAYSAALMDALRAGRPLVFPTVADDAPFNGRQVDAAAVAAVIAGATGEDVRVRRAAVEILGDSRIQRRPVSCGRPSETPTRRYGQPPFDRSLEQETSRPFPSRRRRCWIPSRRYVSPRSAPSRPCRTAPPAPTRQPACRPGFAVRAAAASDILLGPLPRKVSPCCKRCWRPEIHGLASRRWERSKDPGPAVTLDIGASGYGTPTHASGLPRRERWPHPTRREPSHCSCVRSMTTSATFGMRWRVRSVGSARRPWSPPSPPSSIPHRRKERSSRLRSCHRAPRRTSFVGTRERRRLGRWPTSTRRSPSARMETMPTCSVTP